MLLFFFFKKAMPLGVLKCVKTCPSPSSPPDTPLPLLKHTLTENTVHDRELSDRWMER